MVDKKKPSTPEMTIQAEIFGDAKVVSVEPKTRRRILGSEIRLRDESDLFTFFGDLAPDKIPLRKGQAVHMEMQTEPNSNKWNVRLLTRRHELSGLEYTRRNPWL